MARSLNFKRTMDIKDQLSEIFFPCNRNLFRIYPFSQYGRYTPCYTKNKCRQFCNTI